MIRFEGWEPTPALTDFIEEWNIGGVVLFSSNCPDLKKTAQLISHLKSLQTDLPLCAAIDHEGGRVHRLPAPATHFPPLATLGKLYEKMPSSMLALELGRAMGEELRALGIDLNFAPCVDIQTNPFNPVIGDRAASSNPEVVSMVARHFIAAMQQAGVGACAKHFPGHGDTDEDSHLVLPRLPHNLRRLQAMELVPFQTAIQSKVAAIMTAHVVYNGFDKDIPATLSVKVIRDLLRTEMGFEGLIISDDLSMGAIAKKYSLEEGCIKAFQAGCDILLAFCKLEELPRLFDAFAEAVEKGVISQERVEESLGRISKFKEAFCKRGGGNTPNLSMIGSKEHRNLLNKIKELV